MADPKVPVVLGAKVASANIGEFVIFRNLTRGEKLTGRLQGADRNIVLSPAPSAQWEDNDLIQLEIRGRLSGVAQGRISSRKLDFKSKDLAASVDTTTVEVSL